MESAVGTGERFSSEEDRLSHQVIGAVIEVHRQFGPGLLEQRYEEALATERELRGIPFQRQVELPVCYKGRQLSGKLRLDFLVGGRLILELKAVEEVHPIHQAQLLTYLKLTGLKLGLLINFNVERAVDGIQRRVNRL